ncbi:MAG: valine--tRNA ligase [Patescibacteria group bacterium]|jgi:valyl-tRNA synthetase
MPNQPDLPKAYEPQNHEDNIYAAWEKSGFFRPENLPDLEKRKETFSMVLPPPNVTGILHLGHASMLALEDTMTRFARMQGKRALWIPGTDHAAIATQTKVEKELIKKGMKDPRRELGREAFLEEVKKFAAASHDTIVHQIKKMGASLDWSRECYTLDEDRNKAVNTVFKMMYDDGLIYRGHRVINWCPRCKSTLADDEVEHKETTAKFYTFKYDKNFPISISTTRPETKLGDTAVAVHPDDEHYQKFIGQTLEANFVGQKLSIKVIADSAVDPAFGTGALGVTPAHSQIDAEMAQKNNLPVITVIGEDGVMTAEAGAFAGLSVLEAREKIIEQLRNEGLIEKEEETPQNLSVCYRCGAAVEPLPKLQWFIGVNKPFKFHASKHAPIEGLKDDQEITLKELMQHVVCSNQIKIIPEQFVGTYFHWIDNLRDWNISRQIWFGHQVPVWYRGDEINIGSEAPGDDWKRDEDTLDTWFSSGLWTFSTLGWPNKTEDFEMYHPTTVLETGYDIIFFWVARMILMTTYTLGEVPFKNVYLHGLVRDEAGKKMSKSAGNAIDPIEMVEKYGADAVRLSMVIGTSPGNDFKMYEEKIAGFRNFTNKLWNISRFVLTTTSLTPTLSLRERANPMTLADNWILGRLSEVTEKVTNHLEKYEFSQAGEVLRDFTWSELADWYLEIAKIQRKDSKLEKNTDEILLYVLEQVLVLWHPFMPFVTEELWSNFGSDKMLIVHDWPEVKVSKQNNTEFERLREIIEKLRNWRAENKVEPKEKINVTLIVGEYFEIFKDEINLEIIKTLSRVENLVIEENKDGSFDYQFKVDRQIDAGKERERLSVELEEAKKYIVSLDGKLANQEFISKAPAKVVEDMKQKRDEAAKKAEALNQQISTL